MLALAEIDGIGAGQGKGRKGSKSNFNKMKKRSNPEYIAESCTRLFAAVIAQAVEDYKSLESCGVVESGKATGDWPQVRNQSGQIERRKIAGMKDDVEAVQVCHFLKSDFLDQALDCLGVGVSGSRIRAKLNLGK